MRDPENYSKLIATMARQYQPSFSGKEFEDLMQEGYEVFTKVCQQEQARPLSCPFHTALGVQLKQTWLNELRSKKCQKRGNYPRLVSLDLEWGGEDEKLVDPALSYDPTNLRDKFIDLSSEMKTVVQILFESPSEFITLSKNFGLAESILKYLKQFKGWKKNQLKELKTQLSRI